MDIDEFLDREFSELGLATDKNEQQENIELPQLNGEFEPSSLASSISANLSKGNIEEAKQSYLQLWRILLQQKLKWNKGLYEQLLMASRQLSSFFSYASSELKKKSEQINELITKARASIREGRKDIPLKLYSEIQEINNSIPNVFFEEKKLIEARIMDLYKELKNATDNELVRSVSAVVQELYNLMAKINASIKSNDMQNAITNYNKCIELYNQLPDEFLRQKNSIGMGILEIYKSISIYMEITSLQKQLNERLAQSPREMQQARRSAPSNFTGQLGSSSNSAKSMLLNAKKERAKANIKKGLYNEALKDVQESLQIEPNDPEARAMHAKIKTLH